MSKGNGIGNGVAGALKDIYKAKISKITSTYEETYERRRKEVEANPEYTKLTQKIEAISDQIDRLEKQRKALRAQRGLPESSWLLERQAKWALEKRYAELRAELVGLLPEEAKALLQEFFKKSVWEGV